MGPIAGPSSGATASESVSGAARGSAHSSSSRRRALLAGTDLCERSVPTLAQDARDDAAADREGSAAAQPGEEAESEEGGGVGGKGADEIEDEEESVGALYDLAVSA